MIAGRAPYASGLATRELLVRTAERLISERGVEGVSLREVAAAAGQRNTAAVRYHFGDRDGLVGAVFAFRLPALNQRRHAMLEQLRQEGRLDDPRGVVEAYAVPLIEEAATPDSHYVGFLARLSHHNRESHPFWNTSPTLTDSAEESLRLIAQRVPLATSRLRMTRARLITGFVVSSLANHYVALERHLPGTPRTASFTSDLLDVAAAMVTAPSAVH
ncbi:MAG: TetR/AcrR family transcriptional regulator [Acidobacteria bacterium]|nr:TetR/AcrR family transcriptional regulator [Acidobacteriota bacterium]